MKRKETLILIEIAVMIAVFALAAGICLRIFALSGRMSAENTARDRCVTEARNAAEMLGYCAGDLDAACGTYGGAVTDGCWVIRYDENWTVTPDGGAYVLTAEPVPTESEYLGKAVITVRDAEDDVIFTVPAAWQTGGMDDET
ncbi:MAG: hypothetical protein IJ037_08525 [Clostridia bacterium]|nr:hypothetical protein [Clostridia bacterium]